MSDPTIDDRQQLIADIQAARDELVARGRTLFDFVADNGHVCLIGAIGIATNKRFSTLSEDSRWNVVVPRRGRNRTVRTAQHLASILYPEITSRIVARDIRLLWDFNDSRNTTDEDVLALFDKALADLGGLA